MINRDSLILVLTIIAGVLGVILAQFDILPASWQAYRGIITVVSLSISTVAAILKSSPLAGASTPMRDSTTAMMGAFKVYDTPEGGKK